MTTIHAQLRKHLAARVQFTEVELERLVSFLKPKAYNRREKLLHQGVHSKEIFFILNGCLRVFHTDRKGIDKAIMFAVDDWWVTDIYSFTHDAHAIMSIDALEDTQVLSLSKYNFDKLLKELPIFEAFFRQLFQHAYVREQCRSIENLSLSAEERYDQFKQKYPNLLPRISNKHIASYIGVTPEFLSVLRGRGASS